MPKVVRKKSVITRRRKRVSALVAEVGLGRQKDTPSLALQAWGRAPLEIKLRTGLILVLAARALHAGGFGRIGGLSLVPFSRTRSPAHFRVERARSS